MALRRDNSLENTLFAQTPSESNPEAQQAIAKLVAELKSSSTQSSGIAQPPPGIKQSFQQIDSIRGEKYDSNSTGNAGRGGPVPQQFPPSPQIGTQNRPIIVGSNMGAPQVTPTPQPQQTTAPLRNSYKILVDFLRPKLTAEKFKLFADALQSVVGGKLPQEALWKQLPAIVGTELANEAVKVWSRESALQAMVMRKQEMDKKLQPMPQQRVGTNGSSTGVPVAMPQAPLQPATMQPITGMVNQPTTGGINAANLQLHNQLLQQQLMQQSATNSALAAQNAAYKKIAPPVKQISGPGPILGTTTVARPTTAQQPNTTAVTVKAAPNARKVQEDENQKNSIKDITDVTRLANIDIKQEKLLEDEPDVDTKHEDASREPPPFISMNVLKKRISDIAARRGMKSVSEEVYYMIAHSTVDHLRNVIEQLVKISQQRTDSRKDEFAIKITSDPKKQLKAIEQREREMEEKKRKLEPEPEDPNKKQKLTPQVKEEEQRMASNSTALQAVGDVKIKPKQTQPPAATPSTTQPVAQPTLPPPTFTAQHFQVYQSLQALEKAGTITPPQLNMLQQLRNAVQKYAQYHQQVKKQTGLQTTASTTVTPKPGEQIRPIRKITLKDVMFCRRVFYPKLLQKARRKKTMLLM